MLICQRVIVYPPNLIADSNYMVQWPWIFGCDKFSFLHQALESSSYPILCPRKNHQVIYELILYMIEYIYIYLYIYIYITYISMLHQDSSEATGLFARLRSSMPGRTRKSTRLERCRGCQVTWCRLRLESRSVGVGF